MTDDRRWREHEERWTRERLEPALERTPERRRRFITQSGVDIERVYGPSDLQDPANDPVDDRVVSHISSVAIEGGTAHPELKLLDAN